MRALHLEPEVRYFVGHDWVIGWALGFERESRNGEGTKWIQSWEVLPFVRYHYLHRYLIQSLLRCRCGGISHRQWWGALELSPRAMRWKFASELVLTLWRGFACAFICFLWNVVIPVGSERRRAFWQMVVDWALLPWSWWLGLELRFWWFLYLSQISWQRGEGCFSACWTFVGIRLPPTTWIYDLCLIICCRNSPLTIKFRCDTCAQKALGHRKSDDPELSLTTFGTLNHRRPRAFCGVYRQVSDEWKNYAHIPYGDVAKIF